MDLISKHNIVHRYEKRKLLIAVNCVAGLAIFFFGYDQGMMGSVNVSIDYGVNRMKYGHIDPEAKQVVVDNSLLQGGIVSCLVLGQAIPKLIGEGLGILSWYSAWMHGRRLDRRESRSDKSHGAGVCLGNYWCQLADVCYERRLDDLR